MKTFHESNMQDALQKIRNELGSDAIIISTKQNKNGVQVVAATDQDVVASNSDNIKVQEDREISYLNTKNQIDNDRSLNSINKFTNEDIQDEISKLRYMIESQTEIISWNKIINENSVAREILQKLSISGFGFNFSKDIFGRINNISDQNSAWTGVEKIISESIEIVEKNIIEVGGVVALVGPTGVGKTTTIAKIAAQYALKHTNHQIALISTDHYRIGAHDQISTYASILNVPVIAARNKIELQQALHVVRDKKLILIDTPGLCQRDNRVAEIMKTLSEQPKNIDKYLVMSAASQLFVQKEIISQFNSEVIDGAIISKTDETSQIGGILTALIEQGLPIVFETTGQRVPEDLVRTNQVKLLKKAIYLGEKFGKMECFHPTELYSELLENV